MSCRRLATLLLSATALTTGCGMDYDLTAIEELIVTAIDGGEDYLSGDPSQVSGSADMLRDCDASGNYDELFTQFDEDGDGDLSRGEANSVVDELAGGSDTGRAALAGLVRFVYDVDDDGIIAGEEVDAVFADFTDRCEELQGELTASYDSDGDGRLSGPEQGEARDDQGRKGDELGECRKSCSGREGGEAAGVGPIEAEFDRDGDGALSDGEIDEARSTLRNRLRRGDNPHPSCG